jgi:hypothetical protein
VNYVERVEKPPSIFTHNARLEAMRIIRQHRQLRKDRRGMTAPAMLIALVVVMMATGLTLDRIWLQAARAELTTAVESAALRGGRLLASDDLLRPQVDHIARISAARKAAAEIASTNLIAGVPVKLDDSENGDIRFGHIVTKGNKGRELFIETDYNPKSVVVRGEHSRSKNNPVGLFMRSLTGQPAGDVASLAEASIDNHVIAFRPIDGVPAPFFPIGILQFDYSKRGIPAWETEIERRQGQDRLTYDETTNEVRAGADGIPEITLKSPSLGGKVEDANTHFFAINHRLPRGEIVRHIQTGFSETDLPTEYKGLLRLDRAPHEWRTLNVANQIDGEFDKLIGQCRIVCLYDKFEAGRNGEGTIRCVGIVAGRILAVTHQPDGSCEFVLQPGVLTTRTAVIAKEMPIDAPPQRFKNKYIYKLQLTH